MMNINAKFKTKRTVIGCAIVMACGMYAGVAQAAAGDVNTHFNGGAIATSVVGNDEARAIAVQADGKILVGGYSGSAAPHFFLLNRYNTDGTLDTSFSTNGIGGSYVPPPPNQADSYATALAIQSDGKILQAGYSGGDFALVRYNNSNGTLDTSFGGGDGVVVTNLGDVDIATSMAIQADGKILLAGYTGYHGDNDFAIVRYNTDGTLDSSFDSDGIFIVHNPSSDDMANAIAVQADGKILIAGSTAYYDQQTSEPAYLHLRRYNSNGTLDTNFGTNGAISYYGHQNGSAAYAMALQADGQILLAGYANNDSFAKLMLLQRYTTAGLNSGSTVYSVPSHDGARALAVQPDGQILIGGDTVVYNGISTTLDFTVLRYNANSIGMLSSFGTSGVATMEASSDDDHLYALAVNPNGTILAAGTGYMDFSNDNTRNGDNDVVVVNLLASDANNDGVAEALDVTPNAIAFTDAGDVTASTVQTSANVTISGMSTNVSVPVSITGGEYAINAGSYTSQPGYATNNDVISVRHTASATVGNSTNTVLTVGGMHAANTTSTILGNTTSDTYSSTTASAPVTPPTTTSSGGGGGGGALNGLALLTMLLPLWMRRLSRR